MEKYNPFANTFDKADIASFTEGSDCSGVILAAQKEVKKVDNKKPRSHVLSLKLNQVHPIVEHIRRNGYVRRHILKKNSINNESSESLDTSDSLGTPDNSDSLGTPENSLLSNELGSGIPGLNVLPGPGVNNQSILGRGILPSKRAKNLAGLQVYMCAHAGKPRVRALVQRNRKSGKRGCPARFTINFPSGYYHNDKNELNVEKFGDSVVTVTWRFEHNHIVEEFADGKSSEEFLHQVRNRMRGTHHSNIS